MTIAVADAATGFGLGWLVLILGVLLWEGFSGLSLAVFTEMTPPPGSAGGLLNADRRQPADDRSGGRRSARRSASSPAPTWPNTAAMTSSTSVVRFINDILLSGAVDRDRPVHL